MNVGGLGATLLVGTVLFFAGCGHGASAVSAADSAYLSELTAAAPDITTYRNDTQLVRLGHVACDDFSAGAGYQETADRMALEEGTPPLPSEDLGAVITTAIDSLCPKYRAAIG